MIKKTANSKNTKNKSQDKITRDTKISLLLEKYPFLAESLLKDYKLHCVGCFAAAFETLEQGALAHGMSDKDINAMIKDFNKQVKKHE
jgi:hybrid cluster-associated redox disulfide protein